MLTFKFWLLMAITFYLIVVLGLAWWSKAKIHSVEDYLVAGRKLPFSLAWASVFATWFGAGTLLTSADEIRQSGLGAAALEPLGAGLCLIIAGLIYAKPLWKLKILTFSDVFRLKFGKKAEVISASFSVPAYFGWIAAQYMALGGILHLFFGVSMEMAMTGVCFISLIYTVLGGMWSVTLTDIFQMFFLIVGVVLLGFFSLQAGDLQHLTYKESFTYLWSQIPSHKKILIPTESLPDFFNFMGVILVGAIGNISGQDLTQRIFSSRSSQVAQKACLLAGCLYIVVGAVPVFLGLVGDYFLGEVVTQSVIPALVQQLFHPTLQIIFILALVSAILSTIDSALLAPAGLITQNILRYFHADDKILLKLNKLAVVAIAICCLGLAFIGENAYSLLESSYELGLVCFFVPLSIGLFSSKLNEKACLISMVSGISLWSLGFWGVEGFLFLPLSLWATLASFLGYVVTYIAVNKVSK